MDKGKLHHWWRQLKRIKIWHLVVALVIFASLSAVLLRQNNLGMVERRRAVLQADQDNGDVDKALKDLRGYMMRHMNTRMSEPIQLKHSYDRAVKKQLDDIAKTGSANSAVYQQAQEECRRANTVAYAQWSGFGYIP